MNIIELQQIMVMFNIIRQRLNTTENALTWFQLPNIAFNGKTPFDLILNGKENELVNYIINHKEL